MHVNILHIDRWKIDCLLRVRGIMDFAGDLSTGDIVSAEEFWGQTVKNTKKFRCPYEQCHITLSLCSFELTNLKRPYFKHLTGKDHTPDCGLDGSAFTST